MPRSHTRPLLLALALLGAAILSPPQATALPESAVLTAAERHAPTPGLLSQLWSALSAIWSETGSILDPNGANGVPKETNPGAAGDTGSILDPNG